MTATKKPKSAASEREHAVPAAQAPAPRRKDAVQWHEQAAFHLTLDHAQGAGAASMWRTHAYHEESGEERTQPGILHQDVLLWIRARAGAPSEAQEHAVAGADAPPLVETRQSRPIAEPRLSVDELAIEEIEIERQVGEAPIKPLRAHVRFACAGVPADEPGRHASHGTIQVLACARESDRAFVLGACRQRLAVSEPSYTTTLELDLPPLGEYQTIANVVLEDGGLVGAALGPLLTVVQ